jgi:pimeloyl-ACP methyl ester carboxylesterase
VKAAILAGADYSRSQLFSTYKEIDLPSLGREFDIPIFFFQGTEDLATPFELASQYLDSLIAPYKALIPFEGCHHFFVMNRPEDFLRQLLDQVLPHG